LPGFFFLKENVPCVLEPDVATASGVHDPNPTVVLSTISALMSTDAVLYALSSS
jgi:hypothetical protein